MNVSNVPLTGYGICVTTHRSLMAVHRSLMAVHTLILSLHLSLATPSDWKTEHSVAWCV